MFRGVNTFLPDSYFLQFYQIFTFFDFPWVIIGYFRFNGIFNVFYHVYKKYFCKVYMKQTFPYFYMQFRQIHGLLEAMVHALLQTKATPEGLCFRKQKRRIET